MNNREIERTWICGNFRIVPKGDCNEKLFYGCEQYHVFKNTAAEMRFRKYLGEKHNYCELTMKEGQGRVRKEINIEISPEWFNIVRNSYNVELLKFKETFEYRYDDFTIFVSSVNDGVLHYIDVEFKDEDACESFNIYEYFDKSHIKEEIDKSNPKEYVSNDDTIDYVQEYNDFWKEIVEEDGILNKDQVMRELSDYSMVIDNCEQAYCLMSNHNISKVNTKFFEVRDLFNEYFWDKDIIRDDIADALDSIDTLEEMQEFLKEYLEI